MKFDLAEWSRKGDQLRHLNVKLPLTVNFDEETSFYHPHPIGIPFEYDPSHFLAKSSSDDIHQTFNLLLDHLQA